MIVCAIHQPNFFPWLGFFNKMHKSDVMVFLDGVEFSHGCSSNKTNRVKLNISGGANWWGCPVKRTSGALNIKDIVIDDKQPWRKKAIKSLMFNYKKSLNYDKYFPFIEGLINYPETNLSTFNINAINKIALLLGINSKCYIHTKLGIEGSSTDLLINITKKVGATAYMCGGGAAGYQDDELILSSGLELIYQNYKPELYGDASKYIPGLSIIDYLMNNDFSKGDFFNTNVDIDLITNETIIETI